MASVKKQLKNLKKRQDDLERALQDLEPKRIRKLARPRRRTNRGNRFASRLERRITP
jgi:prefoldin subunit 5